MSSDEIDVAQLVIRTSEIGSDSYRYFLARRTMDGRWEWIGGKREDGESIEEAAVRELKEEIKADWDEDVFEIVEVEEEYPSEADSSYMLHPVLIEVDRTDFSEEDLSEEHERMAWIELQEFDDYDTLGQLEALKKLDLIRGDAVVGAVECVERGFLVVRRSESETMTGQWEFTGGCVDEEDAGLEDAAVREVEEEAGIDVELVEAGESYIGEGATGYWHLHPFLLEAKSGEEVELSEEHDRFRWINIDQLEDMKTVGKLKPVEKLGLN